MIKALLKNRVAKNAGWLIGGKVAQMLLSLVVGLLTARYLGPANYGLISYASAYTAFFATFSVLGINSILVKELIDSPEREGEIIGTSIGLRAVSSFLSALAIISISFVIDRHEPTTLWVVGLSSLGLIFHIFEVINFWFQAKLQSKVTAIVSLIAYALTSVYKILLLILGKNVKWFAFAASVDYICIGILLMVAYWKYGGKRFSFSISCGKRMLSKSWHFILPGLMVAVYGQTDKIMLKQMMTETDVGYYATAVSLCNIWCFVLSAIIDSIYPSIMEANNTDDRLFVKRNKQLYAIVFYISVFVSLCFTVFAELAVFLLYGKVYLPAAMPLRIITWYTAFSYLGVARNAWIICKEKQKYLLPVYIAAACSNVLLNLILIPLWGVSGAALASLMAQIITIMAVPFFIKGLRENSKMMIEAILLRGIRG